MLIGALACGDTGPPGNPDSSEGSPVPGDALNSAELLIGVDDQAPGHLLHQVTGLFRTVDGRIVVANGGTSQIRVFDESGSLLVEMGGHGGGPEEFLALQGIFPSSGDSLVAWDPLSRALSVWSLDGEFVRTVPFRLETTPQVEAVLPSGHYLVSVEKRARASQFPPWHTYVDSMDVSVVNPVMETARPLRRYRHRIMVAADAREYGGRRPAVPMPDAPESRLAAYGDSVLLGFPDSSRVIVLSSRGQVLDTVPVPIRRQPRPSSATEARIEEALGEVPEDRQPTIRRYLERFPQPDLYPAFDMLLPDNRGRIWLRHFVRPGEETAKWTVIEEGVATDEVLLPPDFEPVQIDSESLLGLWKGEDDEELVAVFKLGA